MLYLVEYLKISTPLIEESTGHLPPSRLRERTDPPLTLRSTLELKRTGRLTRGEGKEREQPFWLLLFLCSIPVKKIGGHLTAMIRSIWKERYSTAKKSKFDILSLADTARGSKRYRLETMCSAPGISRHEPIFRRVFASSMPRTERRHGCRFSVFLLYSVIFHLIHG